MCVVFIQTPFTHKQITTLEILVLRAFREHSNQTLHSHLLLFLVCCLFKHLSRTTGNHIGDSGAESISRALQSNTSLTSLIISRVLVYSNTFHAQQVTTLEILVLRAFREHIQSNTSLTSLIISCVLFLFKHLSHTTDNHIGYSGAESISRALQSNTSLKSLDISCVFVFIQTPFTHNS